LTCIPNARRLRARTLPATLVVVAGLLTAFTPAGASAASGGVGPNAGPDRSGSGQTTPGAKAKLKNGLATVPARAPRKVQRAIRAANRIVKGKPYCYGGGHGNWNDNCYDCSGSVSYALGKKGARVIDAPMPSGSFMRWGKRGRGRWITTYANGGHMYAVIAGLRLDTSQTAGEGPGWSASKLHQAGFRVRHPRGL
jgi:hypothetical protein